MTDYEIKFNPRISYAPPPCFLILDQEENPMKKQSFNYSIKDESIILVTHLLYWINQDISGD